MSQEPSAVAEHLLAENQNLRAALFYTISMLEAYDREIENAEEYIPGLDLVGLGFCQGGVFKTKFDRLSQIYRGARDYPPDFDYAARLEGFVMRDVKPEVGLYFVFETSDQGVMEGGALDFKGVYQTEAEARRALEFPPLGLDHLAPQAGHVAAFRAGSFVVVGAGRRGADGAWAWDKEMPARAASEPGGAENG